MTAILLWASLALAAPAAGAGASSRHVRAELLSEMDAVRGGRPFWVGLRLEMEPGWHTYWKNPGDSGLATKLAWTLPEGFTAGPIEWPYPRAFTQGPVTSYGYEGEVLLPVQITPPAALAAGTRVSLAVRASWLECREACLPGRAALALALPAADQPSPSASAALFAAARRSLPADPAGWTFETREAGASLALDIRPPRAHRPLREAYFFSERPLALDHAARQRLVRADGGWRLELTAAPNAPRPLPGLLGVLVVTGTDGATEAVRVDARPAGATEEKR